MNFKLENDSNVNHFIAVGEVTEDKEFALTVLRVPPLGGMPRRVVVSMNESATYLQVIKKVQHLAKLDDEIFAMLAERSNEDMAEV